jgi:hypothetical protein
VTRPACTPHRRRGSLCGLLLWFAQQLAGGDVDEVQLRTSLTDYGFMDARIVRLVCQPMLHVQSRLRAFEYNVATHAKQKSILKSGALIRIKTGADQGLFLFLSFLFKFFG